MKIILSRKGFDSANGGVASPILPDDSLVPLPIPAESNGSGIAYGTLRARHGRLGDIVQDLTRGNYTRQDRAHLDPDLRANTLTTRPDGWRPIFGQVNKAQKHLVNKGVGRGDLFLFFGWFRRVELENGHYRFVRTERDIHVIFGWLQVAEILPAGPSARAAAPRWAWYHPHFSPETKTWPANTVYISRKTLTLPRLARRMPGAGVIEKFTADLCLTAEGKSRSIWKLPRFFALTKLGSILSYHDAKRWIVRPDCCYLKSVGRGQEFVIDAERCPKVVRWATELIERNG